MGTAITVTDFDHIVLNVADGERSLRFYCDELGLAPVRVEEWRQGQAPFPSVRVSGATIIDLLVRDRTGENADHFCLVMPAADWEEMVAAGTVPVERSPSKVFGARGTGMSVYTRDPAGNLVELRRYDD